MDSKFTQNNGVEPRSKTSYGHRQPMKEMILEVRAKMAEE